MLIFFYNIDLSSIEPQVKPKENSETLRSTCASN